MGDPRPEQTDNGTYPEDGEQDVDQSADLDYSDDDDIEEQVLEGRDLMTATRASLSAVSVALRSQLGYREVPVNKNKFSTYWKHPAEPWCADYACWGLQQGHALDVPMSSYTPALYQGYVAAGRAGRTPRVGALAFFRWPRSHRIEHVGWVEALRDASRVITLEGNTSLHLAGSQKNGGMTARKVRSRSLIVGYGYPLYGPSLQRVKPQPSARPVLKPGATGQAVLNVKRALNKLGNHLAMTATYDAEMLRVVKLFQLHRRLEADGIIGKATWTELGKVAHS